MSHDIRVPLDFFEEPRTKKLRKKYGDGGVVSVLRLWVYSAKHQPDGDLSKWDADSWQLACGRSAAGMNEFIDFLCGEQSCFLDRDEKNGKKTLKLFNWKEEQPWVFFSKKRSKIARQNASKRWKSKAKSSNADSDADGMLMAQRLHTVGNAPSPSPSPRGGDSPREKIAFEKAQNAWSAFEPLVKNLTASDRIVIDDPITRQVFFDMGGLSQIQEIISQNGSVLRDVFCVKYAALEREKFESGAS